MNKLRTFKSSITDEQWLELKILALRENVSMGDFISRMLLEKLK